MNILCKLRLHKWIGRGVRIKDNNIGAKSGYEMCKICFRCDLWERMGDCAFDPNETHDWMTHSDNANILYGW
jgi:hypothetical protein